jgi:hypothetical protein
MATLSQLSSNEIEDSPRCSREFSPKFFAPFVQEIKIFSQQNKIFLALIFALISFIGFIPALIWCPCGMDVFTVAAWSRHFSEALFAGELYPRWLPNAHAGLGAPIFFYYPPLVFYVQALFYNFIDLWELDYVPLLLASVLGMYISAITCYAWLRQWVPEKEALCGAACYLLIPYHLAHSFYSWILLAQFWSYAWFPLILFFAHRLVDKKKLAVTGFAWSVALLALTNSPNMILFTPMMVLYPLILAYAKNIPLIKILGKTLAGIFFGFALAAIYLLPAYFYQSYSLVGLQWEQEGQKVFSYKLFHLSFTAEDKVVFLGYGIYLLLTLLWLLLCFKSLRNQALARHEKIYITAWLFAGILGVYLNLWLSEWLWRIMPFSEIIQIPSRFLAISGLSATVLLTFFLARANLSKRTKYIIYAAIMAGLYLNTLAMVPAKKVDLVGLLQNNNMDMRSTAMLEILRFKNGVSQFPAHVVQDSLFAELAIPDRLFERISKRDQKISHIEGDAEIEIKKWHPREITLEVTSKNGASIFLNHMYFPGWMVEFSGHARPIERVRTTGLISFSVPENFSKQEVNLRLIRLAPEIWSIVISLWSVALTLVLALISYLQKFQRD